MGAELFEKMKAFITSRSKGAKSKLWRPPLDSLLAMMLDGEPDVAMESYENSLQTSTNVYKLCTTYIYKL